MALEGIVLLDKEPGITSFELVKKVKKNLGVKKAGHTGTLDKFASGLMIICINGATAFQTVFMENQKKYRAVIKLGEMTDTLDPYGRVVEKRDIGDLNWSKVESVIDGFIGKIKQVPPKFSAIRMEGKRVYKRVLEGEEVVLNPREVTIYSIDILDLIKDTITIEVVASKGTYIRSLARDIAERLGTVGYCMELRRLEIGRFNVSEAKRIMDIKMADIIPLEKALKFIPSIEVGTVEAGLVAKGIPVNRIPALLKRLENLNLNDNRFLRLICEQKLIALLQKEDNKWKYFKVIGRQR